MATFGPGEVCPYCQYKHELNYSRPDFIGPYGEFDDCYSKDCDRCKKVFRVEAEITFNCSEAEQEAH